MCLKNILIKEISPDVFLLVNTERRNFTKNYTNVFQCDRDEMKMIVCFFFSLFCYNGLLKMAFSKRLLI